MREPTHTFEFDWWLLTIVMTICVVGLLEIYSSTHGNSLHGMQWKQLGWIGIGLVGMLIFSRIDYNALLDQAPILYLIGIAALVLVLAVGHTRFGARRWIVVGGVVLQVSELVKLIIIIVLARYFSEVRTERLTLTDLVKLGLLVGVPAVLILRQPDLGTALVLLPVAIVGAFLAGINWKHAVGVLALGALVAVVGWNGHFLKPYQKQRLATFVHPEESPHGAGYQILQSEIAVGSGGFWGKGFGKGSQNQLGFVPVRYSDFILAALAEEQGFFGRSDHDAAVFGAAAAAGGQCTESERPGRNVSGDGRGGNPCISRDGKCRDGDRVHASNRHTSAIYELRRFGNDIRIFGSGPGDECANEALRQLSAEEIGTPAARCAPDNYTGERGTRRMRESLRGRQESLQAVPAEPGHSRAVMHRAAERRCSLRSSHGEGDGGFREPARDAGRNTRRRATV